MNAIGYMRISVRDQSRYSLEYQERSIREYCSRNHLNLTELFKDNGESSYTFDRPDYKAVEAFIKKNKGQNQYFIIMDHDRFSRNLSEALVKINELESKYQIKVLATNEALDIDTSDPMVFMQRSMSYMFANQELLRIRKRTRDGMRQAQTSGRYLGRAPFGYLNSKDRDDKSLLLVDDKKAVVVQQIFQEYMLGTPVFEILREARKKGFQNSGNSAIPRILSNCLYAGLVKVPKDQFNAERLTKGIHEAIVTEADFWYVQEKLGNKRPAKSQPKDEFPLRGVLKCWCGKNMTAGYSKGKRKYYLYYRCIEHTETNIPGELIHEKFEELLDTLSFTKNQVNHILKEVKKALLDLDKNRESDIKSKSSQLADVVSKMEKLEKRLMDDVIDNATYKKWFKSYSIERSELADQLAKLKQGISNIRFERLMKLLPEITQLKSLYQRAPLHRKQNLIRGVFKHSLMWVDGSFRTPSIEVGLSHNLLNANEKGLLFLEKPSAIWEQIPYGSP
jgi:site-specific DNA recombinase